jgi:hypothetical protein
MGYFLADGCGWEEAPQAGGVGGFRSQEYVHLWGGLLLILYCINVKLYIMYMYIFYSILEYIGRYTYLVILIANQNYDLALYFVPPGDLGRELACGDGVGEESGERRCVGEGEGWRDWGAEGCVERVGSGGVCGRERGAEE